jgi:hypothetical protein
MRLTRASCALLGAALALGPAAGCGGGEDGKTDLADLKPPPAGAAGKAAAKMPPPPRFGSPPKSKTPQP